LPKPFLLGGRNFWVEAEVDAAMAKLAARADA
jgi:predicted DNA-binding transcriptional regulator AlpA